MRVSFDLDEVLFVDPRRYEVEKIPNKPIPIPIDVLPPNLSSPNIMKNTKKNMAMLVNKNVK